MFFLFMLLVLGTLLFFLVRNGQLGSTAWATNRSPEAEAKTHPGRAVCARRHHERRIHGARQRLELDSRKRFLGCQERQEAALIGDCWLAGRR